MKFELRRHDVALVARFENPSERSLARVLPLNREAKAETCLRPPRQKRRRPSLPPRTTFSASRSDRTTVAVGLPAHGDESKFGTRRVATPDARILREAATGVVPSTDIFGLISTWEPARTLHLRPIGIGEEIEAANISIPLTPFRPLFFLILAPIWGADFPFLDPVVSLRSTTGNYLSTLQVDGQRNLKGCQKVAGGRSDAEISGRHLIKTMHPGGVPESALDSELVQTNCRHRPALIDAHGSLVTLMSSCPQAMCASFASRGAANSCKTQVVAFVSDRKICNPLVHSMPFL